MVSSITGVGNPVTISQTKSSGWLSLQYPGQLTVLPPLNLHPHLTIRERTQSVLSDIERKHE